MFRVTEYLGDTCSLDRLHRIRKISWSLKMLCKGNNWYCCNKEMVLVFFIKVSGLIKRIL